MRPSSPLAAAAALSLSFASPIAAFAGKVQPEIDGDYRWVHCSDTKQACENWFNVDGMGSVSTYRLDLWAPPQHCSRVIYTVTDDATSAELGRTKPLKANQAGVVIVRNSALVLRISAIGVAAKLKDTPDCNKGHLGYWGVKVNVGYACDNEEGFPCTGQEPDVVR